jgi:hypothetical protein
VDDARPESARAAPPTGARRTRPRTAPQTGALQTDATLPRPGAREAHPTAPTVASQESPASQLSLLFSLGAPNRARRAAAERRERHSLSLSQSRDGWSLPGYFSLV